MKNLTILFTTFVVILLVTCDFSAGIRRSSGSTLRRRQLPEDAIFSPSYHHHFHRPLPPTPPPRCHTDVTVPEAAEEYEAKVKSASYVFTGKVTKITNRARDFPFAHVDAEGAEYEGGGGGKYLEVRLKRALKGEFPWSLLDVELSKPHLHKTVEVRVRATAAAPGDDDNGETTASSSSHNSREQRCRHVLRQNHTAIFLARRDDAGKGFRLELTSNPLAVTLRNLDKVTATAKGTSPEPVL